MKIMKDKEIALVKEILKKLGASEEDQELVAEATIDADLKGYFDNINHDLIIKGLETHIKDKNLIRLIKRFLKVGICQYFRI